MRIPFVLALTSCLACAIPADAQQQQQQQQQPQTFLLGEWTGGLFPPPTVISADQCLAQPTVIFTRDTVMRASFTEEFYTQRLVETVRGTGNGVVFRFSAASSSQSPSLTGLGGDDSGFGCDSPDEPPRGADGTEPDQLPQLQRLSVPAGTLSRGLKTAHRRTSNVPHRREAAG